jgi:heat shock protein HspQ
MTSLDTKFAVGQVVHHRVLDYRGVVVDVDDEEAGLARRPGPPRPRRAAARPWYRVLVHETDEIVYVNEGSLEADTTGHPVEHPLLPQFFNAFRDGYYIDIRSVN